MVNNAEAAILKWCRNNPHGPLVMRNGADGNCLVLDLTSTEPVPDPLYDGHRRSRTIARESTWERCAEVLGIEVG